MRVITLDANKKVTSVKTVGDAYVLQANDIITELGEVGQIQQADGSFINDTTPITPPIIQPTNQEISDNQIVIMGALGDMYIMMLG